MKICFFRRWDKVHSLIYTRRALRDLKRIQSYIARVSYPTRAAAYVERIMASCRNLPMAPYQGAVIAEIGHNVRRVGFERRVTILFEVEEAAVVILSVSYAGRQFDPDIRAH